MERVLGKKVNFTNLVIYSLSILTSCQFTNEPNREISRGVFQNRGVCGQAFPLLLSPSPFHFFFCSRSNFRAITRLETLATQAMTVVGYEPLQIYNRTAVSILGKVSFCHRARRELKLGIQNAGFLRWLDWIFWWDTSQV